MAGPGLQTFFREVHVNDGRLALRRFVSTNLRGRCPACGHARVVAGALDVVETCALCGSRMDRMEGNLLVSMSLLFVATTSLLAGLGTILVLRYGFFGGLSAVLAGVGCALVVLLVRPMRVLTLWLLWLSGFVYPDRATEKGRHLLPARAEDDPVTHELRAERSGRSSTA